jgi:hypothetical protein
MGETCEIAERVNWVKEKDRTSWIYYRKSDERNCGYVQPVYSSSDWLASAYGQSLGHYRTQLAAIRAVEQKVDPEIVAAVAFPVK